MRVELDPAAAEPFGFRISADEHKQVPHLAHRLNAAAFVAPRNGGKPARRITAKAPYLRVRVKRDRGRRRNPIDQVARHARRQTFASYQHVNS